MFYQIYNILTKHSQAQNNVHLLRELYVEMCIDF